MKNIKTDIAVIGGGASGLCAAIGAAEFTKGEITVIEKLPRVGKKILSTGNGKCNLSNAEINAEKYTGDTELLNYIGNDIKSSRIFFQQLGLACKTDVQGRIYPHSLAASCVLDALRFSVQNSGVEALTENAVTDIKKAGNGFTIKTEYTEISAKRVIIAVGGKAAPSLGTSGDGYKLCEKLGHKITPLYPALAPLRTDVSLVKGIKGLRAASKASLISNGRILGEESGEVQFTDGALSGICIFNLSAKAASLAGKCEISLDIAPDYSYEEISQLISKSKISRNELSCEELMTGLFHKRIGQALLKTVGVPLSKTCKEITDKEIKTAAKLSKDWRFPVTGVSDWSLAQITCGGVPACEVTEKLESVYAKGMFLCGEILNIQGMCGGYNLDWAWKSGYTAGKNAALSLNGAI